MTRFLSACALAVVLGAGASWAALAAQSAEAYKLGMFRHDGRDFAGLVLNDAVVVDLSRAGIDAPATVHEIVARWDAAMADRLARLAASARQARPAFAHDLSAVTTLPPIRNPHVILNAAVNYAEHGAEMGTNVETAKVDPKVAQGIPGMWSRQAGDPRHNPYFFMKAASAITADKQPIIIPTGRDRIDWECEMAVVIGRRAKRVSAAQAPDYIFGYTLLNDVSDRGGRPDGRHGSDWLIGKSHDTFAPLGPYVVPKQFIADPQKLALKFTLNGKVMQDSDTSRMVHTINELVEYASHILTLQPGDIIATGSPAGVGTARETPIYYKAGDTSVCTIEGIGTLTNPVRAEEAGTER